MKIFCTVFPFVEPSDQANRMGRFVANYEFLKALLQYSNFEGYHLFCMNPGHLQATAQTLQSDPDIDASARSKIQLYLYSSLVEKLASTAYHCCHLGGWGYFFSGMVQLRNQHSCEPFPVTGVIHSLNHRDAATDAIKLVKAPLQAYDAVVCSSQCGQQVMRHKLDRVAELDQCPPYRGQFSHIPLGVDHQFESMPERQEARSRLGIDSDSVVLLYPGRLSPTTKADLYPLLLVVQTLLQRCTVPVQLLLAGGASPSDLQLHQAMIEELQLQPCVRILDNFDPKLKTTIYSAADICVAPSDNIQETFGISIIEAMAAGLPVVAADLSGYRELVDQGQTGFKVDTLWIDQLQLAEMDEIMNTDTLQTLLAQSMVLDLAQLEDYLYQLITKPDLRLQMGTAGKLKASQQYRWKTVIQHYQTLWDTLKQQAEQQGIEQQEGALINGGLFSNDYLNSFAHYPSQQLSENHRVAITGRGKEVLTKGQLPAFYGDCAMLIEQQWLGDTLSALVEQKTGQPLSVATVLGEQACDKRRFTLLWAAKYGLLTISAD